MNKRILIFLLPVMFVISCGEDFTSLAPLSQRNAESFYKTETDFKVAINGVYDALQANGTYNNNFILLLEMRADNTANGGGATGLAQAFERIDTFSELTDNSESGNAWSASYKGIARANKVIAELDKGPDVEPAFADRIRGEALFIRSLLYYNLAVIFGNIPLQLEAVSSPNVEINQVDAATVYNQISGDLKSILDNNLLPARYTAENLGKATSGAAATLLGKIYLTMGRDSDAETVLRTILGEYELVENFEELWGPDNENNSESIFEIQFKAGGIDEGSRFTDIYTPLGEGGGVGGGNAPQVITDGIINAYDQDSDERFEATFELNTFTTDPDDYYVEKFASTPFGPFDADNNWIELRYADVLLMLAEAIGESSESYGYINEVRNRAELGNIGPATPGTFEEKLLEERRREFAFENKRWPDLLRFGVAKEVMSTHLGLPESRITLLYPIPQQEINVAPDEMVQNPEHR
jgi:hypothetical protein